MYIIHFLFIYSAEDALTAPRLEPEAELKHNGTWTRIDTEANEVKNYISIFIQKGHFSKIEQK